MALILTFLVKEKLIFMATNHSRFFLQNFSINILIYIFTIIKVMLKENCIIFNPGGYTHTSIAIGDAIAAITSPVIEVHISNVHGREDFRKISYVSGKATGSIFGLGLKGYELALEWFVSNVIK
jgi:3-dehydroquinate dehydratase-2